jgi:aspartate--ammonia ligase
MGIRVNAASLKAQLRAADCTQREKYPYHQMILNDKLPLTIGGGIGQSRLCMLLLGKAHIGEVQSSLWPQGMRETCAKNGINLL